MTPTRTDDHRLWLALLVYAAIVGLVTLFGIFEARKLDEPANPARHDGMQSVLKTVKKIDGSVWERKE